MSPMSEAGHSDAVRSYLRQLNSRLGRPGPGQKWVRVRPPSVGELRDSAADPRFIKFLRPGSEVSVVEAPSMVSSVMVDASCAGDRVLWDLDEFLGTFVRLVPQEAWTEFDNRAMAG